MTWKSRVRDAMRRQPIPDPIEHLDFHVRLDAICNTIASEILTGAYTPHSPIRFLSEKSKGLCRQLVLPSAKDALILQTLSDALWAEIRTKAPTNKSFYAPSDQHFSKKSQEDDPSPYGSMNAWLAFQESIFGFATKKKFIIATDIANYFDSISYDHLRNILADLSLAREHALDLLLYTLSWMLWQPDYMPRVPIGLPQANLDAPRLLAHSFLFEIDEFLSLRKGIDFARYMDDIDIGVDSFSEAKEILRDLDLALQTRQIRLNSGKTRILTESAAYEHYKIRENHLLDKLAKKIDLKKAAGDSLEREVRQVGYAIRGGVRRGAFVSGNGEKIFKRTINFARMLHVDLDNDLFFSLLSGWPSLRPTVLNWWQNRLAPEAKLHLIKNLFVERLLVDDASRMDVIVAIVAARLERNKEVDDQIGIIAGYLDESSSWGLYSKIWLLSKYGSSIELMKLIESTVSLWVTQEHLSRLVAGLWSRFVGSSLRTKFEAILRRAGNAWSNSVLQFHMELSSGTVGYTAVKNFIQAPNPSLPNLISHAKFLMLLSILHNLDLVPTAVTHLKKVHQWALADEYYELIVP